MSQIRVSEEAHVDVRKIRDHISQHRPRAAERMVSTILDKYTLLARFPELGPKCDELAPGLRYFVVRSYVIFYRPVTDGVEIVRVVHGARDLPALFKS